MAELANQLKERYPLLTSLRIAESQSVWEPLPRFLGLLMAAAESPDRKGCCFVFPDASRIACTTATLLALSKLTHEFDDLAREYARRKFEPGQQVIIRPTGHVYEYTGVWDLQDGHPDRFKLQVLGGGGARSLPVSEILRLEPTTRKRPKGQVATPLGGPGHSDLDRLLEIASYGNRALCENRVMCLTSRTEFEAFVENTELCRLQASATNGAGGDSRLHDILPWGSIHEDGFFVLEDRYQAEGEPLLAATNHVENIAEASALAEPFSRVVFADGPEKLVRNLQVCDEITDSQKLIVVADYGSNEALSILEKRNFCVWRVDPEEMQLEHDTCEEAKSVFFSRTFAAANNYQKLQLDGTNCRHERLEAVASDLDYVARYLSRSEGNEEMKGCLRGFFYLLFRLCDRCIGLEAQERAEILDRITILEQAVERQAIYVPGEMVARLRAAGASLREAVSEGTMISWLGKSKSEALLEVLRANDTTTGRRRIIVTRYPESVDATGRWLELRGINVPVVCYSHFPSAEMFDQIIVLAWLNSERFGKLVQRYSTPEVCLLSYPFELKWLRQFDSRLSYDRGSRQLNRTERSKLLGLPEDLLGSADSRVPEQTRTNVQPPAPDPFSIFDIEQRIMRRRKGRPPAFSPSQDTCLARYVGFAGDAYAYLTENHEVPVITDLIKKDDSSPSPIPSLTVNGLRTDDFLLFREESDRDVIQLFAEQLIGPDRYVEQRTLATVWRQALLLLGGSAREVQRHLGSYGLRRTETTIRGWMRNQSVIGPEKRSDVEAIAAATGEERFNESPERVWESIEAIRAAHISAGHKLSEWLLAELATKRSLVTDGEAVDLDFGRFWIVEVEDIGDDLEQYPLGQINCLLWDHGH